MRSPFNYDLKRTLTSKTVILLMLLPILISLAIIPFLSQASIGPQFGSSNTRTLVYRDNNSYHFLVFSVDRFGQPLSGVNVQMNLTDSQNNYRAGGATNSSGFAFFAIDTAGNGIYTVEGSVSEPSGGSLFSSQRPLEILTPNGTEPLPSGQIMSLFGGPILIAVDSNNASKRTIEVFWTGPYGASPSDYDVYYRYMNSTTIGQPAFEMNRSQMQLLGMMKGYSETFSPPPVPSNVSRNDIVVFVLFSPNGTAAYEPPLFTGVDQLYPDPSPPIPGSRIASQFFEGIMGIFIPLMAIIGSYSAYGKDRISGVLESILSKPISRRGLAVSRYLSTFLALSVAITVAIVAVDLIVWGYTGSLVESQVILSATCAFLVELAAFVGIIFFISRLVKSTGALIGISIGLFVVLDFFWSIIISLVASVSRVTMGSAAYLQISVFGAFANPTQFVSLIDLFLGNRFESTPINASAYGVTITSLVAAGFLWIAVPLALFLYLAMRRD